MDDTNTYITSSYLGDKSAVSDNASVSDKQSKVIIGKSLNMDYDELIKEFNMMPFLSASAIPSATAPISNRKTKKKKLIIIESPPKEVVGIPATSEASSEKVKTKTKTLKKKLSPSKGELTVSKPLVSVSASEPSVPVSEPSVPVTKPSVSEPSVPVTKPSVSEPSVTKPKTSKPKTLAPSTETSLPLIKSSNYYMDNRQKFISFINNLFYDKYKKDIDRENISDENQCEQSEESEFSLMSHQKIIKDYINLYTPYRGLLLYHGLGSGKTCSSIAIAEGMKTAKEIVVMTPASLQTNFNEELKKCGDLLYKKNQAWTFVKLDKKNDEDKKSIKEFSKLLNIDEEYIKRKNGVWMVKNEDNKATYDDLTSDEKKSLDDQIDIMIKKKYKFIAYNGIQWNHLNDLTKQYTINPFDNKVILIDEAHNFISRIVNKIEHDDGKKSVNISDLIKENKESQNEYNEQFKLKIIKKKQVDEATFNLKVLEEKNVSDEEQKTKKEKIGIAKKELNVLEQELKKITDKISELKHVKNSKKRDLGSLSCRLYDYLMEAQNAKIILLSGTPIINYPNEIAILFNILRGKIKTWHFNLSGIKQLYTNKDFDKMLQSSASKQNNESIYDYLDYNKNTHTLMVTRNPFGFVNSVDENGNYKGTHRSLNGEITDKDFQEKISKIIKDSMPGISIKDFKIETFKALPDNKDLFNRYFLSESRFINEDLFKRRILGLTSYFRSAQESLMPAYDTKNNLHIVNIDMSDHQYALYNEARLAEIKKEDKDKLKKITQADDLFSDEKTSTYRIFSRAFCNFVFPSKIKRPFPKEDDTLLKAISSNINEDIIDSITINEKTAMSDDSIYEQDDIEEEKERLIEEKLEEGAVKHKSYADRINKALTQLKDKKMKYLSMEKLDECSPKFLRMLKNINAEKDSLHLIYSQFRTLEGIGILKLILEENGYAQFKTKINPQTKEMELDVELIKGEDGKYKMAKPTFVLYTGTETKQEKELIRNIFNGNWKYVPSSLAKQLKSISDNNMYGEIINIFMITASGAEGISLKNVRFVHIAEPYWHPVRKNQVIGRARRICSHQDLPKELRTVDVYLYLMKFSESQLKDIPYKITLADDNMTSDETLNYLSNKKENITESILRAVKESSIDCAIHKKQGDGLKCFSFGSSSDENKLSFVPSYEKDQKEGKSLAVREEVINIQEATVTGSNGNKITFYINKDTGVIYDPESYKMYENVKDVSVLKKIGDRIAINKGDKIVYNYKIITKSTIIPINVRENNDYSDVYRQKQQSLGCGRHAINNLIGKDTFTKDEMLKICDAITTAIGSENKKYVCDTKNEYYSQEVLYNALKSIFINSEFIYDSIDPKTGEQQMTIDYIKKRVKDIESKNNDVIGFVINVDEKHYYAMKRLIDDNDKDNAKYLKIDSINTENNLSVFTVDEMNDIKGSKGIILVYKKKPMIK